VTAECEKNKNLVFNAALAIYKSVLEIATEPAAIQEISGHLGAAGFYQEALDLLLPRFVPERDGPTAALNLLHCCEDAGDFDAGLQLVQQLKPLDWPCFGPLLESFESIFSDDFYRQKKNPGRGH